MELVSPLTFLIEISVFAVAIFSFIGIILLFKKIFQFANYMDNLTLKIWKFAKKYYYINIHWWLICSWKDIISKQRRIHQGINLSMQEELENSWTKKQKYRKDRVYKWFVGPARWFCLQMLASAINIAIGSILQKFFHIL